MNNNNNTVFNAESGLHMGRMQAQEEQEEWEEKM